jgi:putative ABC transport system substrate-binding protein
LPAELPRAAIISAAARNNVPAVYTLSDFARGGGLLYYGVDRVDLFRRAASYVDRILRGTSFDNTPKVSLSRETHSLRFA